ncbi:hypothetical protein HDE68_001195 [Pedobacter cryoconitis]|uniref:Uncharacterized protein n=1 Tax=Pedobacter cryoconitis TaxID=188932 RepID=A0A7W8ZK53_9SPHI|nr:leucine-rich repeat domain-containing protein [Pedobacter cryoconitis]MBB5635310.1 hypothetical protein [Pedobacter cryoconitis]
MLHIKYADVFASKADLIIVPVDTDGAISFHFSSGLDKLGVEIPYDVRFELGEVVVVKTNSTSRTKFIAFACTYDEMIGSSYAAIKEIGTQIGKTVKKLKDIKTIASPFLATGAGRLLHFQSHNILIKAFYEQETPDISFDLYTNDIGFYNNYSGAYDTRNETSTQLVFEASIEIVMNDSQINQILSSDNYYYQLAEDKYAEFKNWNHLDRISYENIRKRLSDPKINFREYLINVDPDSKEHDLLKLCGELVAYIDFNAYLKNLWNAYPDKRVLAKSGVYQNNWINNLIKFKETGNIDLITASNIRNALSYLDNPYDNLPMLSEEHRRSVFKKILLQEYKSKDSLHILFDYFQNLGISCLNRKNNNALYSRVLYHPMIRPLWTSKKRKNDSNQITEPLSLNTDIQKAFELIFKCFLEESKSLDLGRCGITDLSLLPELFECTNLEELTISNEWSEFKNGKWQRRESINTGSRNRLQSIPNEIKRLKKLKKLICGGDWNDGEKAWNKWGIKSINELLSLKNLEHINVSNNNIQEVPNLSSLKNLIVIHLNNNKINRIESLNSLINLKELYLSNNLIEDISFLKGVLNISTLDLHTNGIRDLRPIEELILNLDIKNSKWRLDTINIANNPLEQPPIQTINTGRDAVLSYFEDIRDGDTYINKDIKVILVGNSEAGKTTLAKYLNHKKDLEKPHAATHWMHEQIINSKYEIKSIGKNCVIRLFDFGGHDYFHDTHHLFFGVNTIYILLWEVDTNLMKSRKTKQINNKGSEVEIQTQDFPIKYWLDSVKYFTKEAESDNFGFEIVKQQQYNSSLLIIQNKVDNPNLVRSLNNEAIKKKYPFVYEFLNLAITTGRNLDYFDSIITEMLNETKLIGAELPRFYEKVKDNLLEYSGKPILSLIEFQAYCNSILNEKIDLNRTKYLASYLKQIGVILWFPKGLPEDKIYAKKRWVIDNIYYALNDLSEKNGEFKLEDLVNSLESKDKQEALALIEVMTEFKIIFKHPYNNKYIAPLYLEDHPGNNVNLFLNENIIPIRRFEYSGFIHKSVILSLFQRYGKMILDEEQDSYYGHYYYWKNGLIIKGQITHEIVMIKFNLGSDDGNAHIDVYHISGPKSIFIKEVIEYIKEINKDYEIVELVTLDGENFIAIDLLNEYAKIGRFEFTETRLPDYSKSNKLEEKIFKLKDYTMYLNNDIKKRKVAISYSKKDLVRVDTFIRYLKPLVDNDLIELPWYCSDLEAGSNWNSEIEENFDNADIVFFMISDHFFDTDYIVKQEIPKIIDRYLENKSVKVVPIILVPYPWGRNGKYNLQTFSALPFQAKPVSDYNDENMAWNMISICIKIMIEKELDPGKNGGITRELKTLYERQVEGKLDKNS